MKKSVWGRGGLLRKGRGPNPVSLTPVGLDHAPQSNLGLNDTSSTGSETNTNIGSESGSLDASTAVGGWLQCRAVASALVGHAYAKMYAVEAHWSLTMTLLALSAAPLPLPWSPLLSTAELCPG